jgi:diguanylate cyclase (GGDEF)-like protein
MRSGGGSRSWLERIASAHGWTAADRCAVASALILFATLVFSASMFVTSGWPYLQAEAEPSAPAFGGLALVFSAVWLCMLGLSLIARKRAPKNRLLVHATVQLYALSIAGYTCLTGPFSGPSWIAVLGGAIVGLLMFGRRATLPAIGTFLVAVSAGALLLVENVFPRVTELVRAAGGLEGSESWVRMWVASVRFTIFVIVIIDRVIARWRWHASELERLSRTDSLTGLLNRRRFLEMCEREQIRAARYGRPLSLVLVDLDHFKQVNDTHGHAAGDQVLVEVARVLRSGVRDVDLVARYGGEEFAVLLPDTGRAGAEEVAARCLRLIESTPILVDSQRLDVTASMGVAAIPHERAKRVEDLIRLADDALYRAKREGRNRVVAA